MAGCRSTRLFAVSSLVFFVLGAFGTQRVPEDIEASTLAVKRANEFCSQVDFSDVDPEEAREELTGAVGDTNIFLDAMKEANSPDDFNKKIGEKIDYAWMMGTAGALVMAVILFVIWCFCCWTACPCCKCCRCGAKERLASLPVRVVVAASLAATLAGMVMSAMWGASGKDNMIDGMDSVGCTSARLLNYTLNGNSEHGFLGMLPLMDQFSAFSDLLTNESDFVTSLESIMDSTAEIARAVKIVEQSLLLLGQVVELPQIVNPITSLASERSFHKCIVCEELGPLLTQFSSTVQSSVASALESGRAEVDTQLGPAGRQSLKDTFDASLEPMRQSADTVRDTTKIFLTDDFVDLKEQFQSYFGNGIIMVSALVFGISICGIVSDAICAVKEFDDRKEKKGKNPWNQCIAPFACCTWCTAWFYAIFLFFLGGLMVVVNVFLSSGCLIAADVSSQMLRDILPALGDSVNASSPQYLMVSDMIDSCFAAPHVSPPTNKTLTDIIFIEENGTHLTIRQKVKSQSTDLIDEKFQAINDQLSSALGEKLSTNPSVVSLIGTLSSKPVNQLITTQTALVTADPYRNMLGDPRSQTAGVQIGFVSSLSCNDFVQEGLGTVNGMSNFTQNLLGFNMAGTSTPSSPATSCTANVVCNRNPATGAAVDCNSPEAVLIASGQQASIPVCRACAAANDFMNFKAQLMTSVAFRCDKFSAPDGSDCDVLDMRKENGVWKNDCLATDSQGGLSMTIKPITCTFPEFVEYFSNWSTRLSRVINRVDDATEQTQNKIAVDLQGLINRSISHPVTNMMDESKCTFLKNEFKDLIWGFCFKGVVGYRWVAQSYLATGILTIPLIIICYAIWRHGVDNRNVWNKKQNPSKVSPEEIQVLPAEPSATQPDAGKPADDLDL